MRYSHLLLAMPLAFGLYACGGDSPTHPHDQVPVSSDATGPGPLPASSADGGIIPPQSSAAVAPATVSLAANANIANATALYATWKARWIMTLQDEKTGGSVLGCQQVPDERTYWRPAIDSSVVRYGAGGSDLIRAVQRRLGCGVDGLLGPATIKAIQAIMPSMDNIILRYQLL